MGNQLLNFSVPEPVRSQSASSPEVIQNCTGFTFAGLAVAECSVVTGLIPCMLCCVLCVVCIGLLAAEFSAANTELGRPMFGNS